MCCTLTLHSFWLEWEGDATLLPQRSHLFFCKGTVWIRCVHRQPCLLLRPCPCSPGRILRVRYHFPFLYFQLSSLRLNATMCKSPLRVSSIKQLPPHTSLYYSSSQLPSSVYHCCKWLSSFSIFNLCSPCQNLCSMSAVPHLPSEMTMVRPGTHSIQLVHN